MVAVVYSCDKAHVGFVAVKTLHDSAGRWVVYRFFYHSAFHKKIKAERHEAWNRISLIKVSFFCKGVKDEGLNPHCVFSFYFLRKRKVCEISDKSCPGRNNYIVKITFVAVPFKKIVSKIEFRQNNPPLKTPRQRRCMDARCRDFLAYIVTALDRRLFYSPEVVTVKGCFFVVFVF